MLRVAAAAIAGAVILAARPGVASPSPAPTFALVGYGGGTDPGGADAVTCLDGKYASGVPVLLLHDSDSSTCQVRTGEVVGHFHSGQPCTTLIGLDQCKEKYFGIGVLGARGAFRRGPAPVVFDDAQRKALVQALTKAKAAETASARWKAELGQALYEAVITDAVSFPALGKGPVLVRLKVSNGEIGGPWVAVAGGQVGAMVGPFSERLPKWFTLDGRDYLEFHVAVCWACGGGGTEIHAVEGGKLREVMRSYANSN